MPSDLAFWLPYYSGDIPSSSPNWFIAYHPSALLYIFAFMSNGSMGRSLWCWNFWGSLCIRRSSAFLYLLG